MIQVLVAVSPPLAARDQVSPPNQGWECKNHLLELVLQLWSAGNTALVVQD